MREGGREGQTERDTHTIWSRIQVPKCQQRAHMGLEWMNCEIMTWAEVGGLTNWATQAPQGSPFLDDNRRLGKAQCHTTGKWKTSKSFQDLCSSNSKFQLLVTHPGYFQSSTKIPMVWRHTRCRHFSVRSELSQFPGDSFILLRFPLGHLSWNDEWQKARAASRGCRFKQGLGMGSWVPLQMELLPRELPEA